MEIDTEDDEVRYLGDVTLHSSARDRAALLEILVWREAVPGCWHTRDQFARSALSPALVNAVQRGACETMQVRFDDTWWTFALGWPGFLATMAGPDECLGKLADLRWLLQGPGTEPFAVLAWRGQRVVDEDGNEIHPDFADPVDGYTTGLATRIACRDACIRQPRLQEQCGIAFATEVASFLEDWFAILPVPCGPASATVNWRRDRWRYFVRGDCGTDTVQSNSAQQQARAPPCTGHKHCHRLLSQPPSHW